MSQHSSDDEISRDPMAAMPQSPVLSSMSGGVAAAETVYKTDWRSFVICRVLLPIVLVLGLILRANLPGLLCGVLYVVVIQLPAIASYHKRFVQFLAGCYTLICLGHIAFQASVAIDKDSVDEGSSISSTWEAFGMGHIDSVTTGLRLILPDVIVLVTAVISLKFIDWTSDNIILDVMVPPMLMELLFWLSILFYTLTFLAKPSLLCLPYVLLFALWMSRFSSKEECDVMQFKTRTLHSILIYSTVHIFLIYSYQFDLVPDVLPNISRIEKVDSMETSEIMQLILLVISYSLFSWFLRSRGYILKYSKKAQAKVQTKVPNTASLSDTQELETEMDEDADMLWANFVTFLTELLGKIHASIQLYGFTVPACCLVVIYLINPSFLTFVFFLWFIFGLNHTTLFFQGLLRQLRFTLSAVCFAKYIVEALDMAEGDAFLNAGLTLSELAYVELGFYAIAIFLFTWYERVWRRSLEFSGSAVLLTVTKTEEKMKNSFLLTHLVRPLALYSYEVSLICMLILGLSNVNFINLGLVILFFAYQYFVGLTEKHWGVLVVYSLISSLAMFLWQIPLLNRIDGWAPTHIGVVGDDEVLNCLGHLGVHILIVLQYSIKRSKYLKRLRDLTPLKAETDASSTRTLFYKLLNILSSLWNRALFSLGIFVSYGVMMSLAITRSLCVLNYIYLFLIFIGLLIYQWTTNYKRNLGVFWKVFPVYSAILTLFRYVYQFDFINNPLEEDMNFSKDFNAAVFGLEEANNSFTYIIGDCFAFMITNYQLKLFRRKASRSRSTLPKAIKDFIKFVKRVAIIHHGTFMRLLLFVIACENLNAFGLFYLILSMVWLILLEKGVFLCFFLVIYCQMVTIAVYIVQFPEFEDQITDTTAWIGLKRYDDVWAATRPHLIVMCFALLQSATSFWSQKLLPREKNPMNRKECRLFALKSVESGDFLRVCIWKFKTFCNTYYMQKEGFIAALVIGGLIKSSAIGTLYILLAPAFILMSRSNVHKFGRILLLAVTIFLVAQYCIALGPPEELGGDSRPWDDISTDWQYWLNLKFDGTDSLYGDFVVLFFLVQLLRDTKKNPKRLRESSKKLNEELKNEIWSDQTALLYMYYRYGSRLILAIILLIATASYDIFSLVLSVGCILMLCHTTVFDPRYAFKWNALLSYNLFVLLIQAIFQIPWIKHDGSDLGAQMAFGLVKLGPLDALNNRYIITDILTFLLLYVQYDVVNKKRFEVVISYAERSTGLIGQAANQCFQRLVQEQNEHEDALESLRAERLKRLESIRQGLGTVDDIQPDKIFLQDPIQQLLDDTMLKNLDTNKSSNLVASPIIEETRDEHSISEPQQKPPRPKSAPVDLGRFVSLGTNESDSFPVDGEPRDGLYASITKVPVAVSEYLEGISKARSSQEGVMEEDDDQEQGAIADDEEEYEPELIESPKNKRASQMMKRLSGLHNIPEIPSSAGPAEQAQLTEAKLETQKDHQEVETAFGSFVSKIRAAFKPKLDFLSYIMRNFIIQRPYHYLLESRVPNPFHVNGMNFSYQILRQNTHNIVFFLALVNALVHANLVSSLGFLYAVIVLRVEYPVSRKAAWDIYVLYFEAVLLAKYIFQFNGFCYCYSDIISYSFEPECNSEKCGYISDELEALKMIQAPYLVGIIKLSKDFFFGAFLDFALLMISLLHCSNMDDMGAWDLQKHYGKWIRERNMSKSLETGDAKKISPSASTTSFAEDARLQKAEMQSSMFDINKLKGYLEDMFMDVTDFQSKRGTDLYVPTFIIGVFIFFFIAFFYNQIVDQVYQGLSDVISSNTISGEFVAVLIMQFVLIIIDRYIYIKRSIRMKFVLFVVHTVAIHWLLLYSVPMSAQLGYEDNKPLVALYVLELFYIIISGLQVYYGYPYYTRGQFLTRHYGRLAQQTFTLYRAIPFLYELRTLLDWIAIRTALDFSGWMKVEDIYCNLYTVKCGILEGRSNPREFGQKRTRKEKFVMGTMVFVFLCVVVWFPLLLMSSSSPAVGSNLVLTTSLRIGIQEYPVLYVSSLDENSLPPISKSDFNKLRPTYKFLNPSDYIQTQIIPYHEPSDEVWTISPPNESNLLKELQDPKRDMSVKTYLVFTRKDPPESTILEETHYIQLSLEQRLELVYIIGNGTGSITVPGLLPRFLRLTVDGEISAIPGTGAFDCTLTLQSDGNVEWWSVKQATEEVFDGAGPEILTISAATLLISSSLLGTGIVGLYVGVVFTIGQFVRLQVSDIQQKIIYDDLPDVTKLIQLCDDLYTARSEGELILEEQLYEQLVSIYRSPELLIELTKEKDE
eukprot:TRINITY_DN5977_c0_g1_i3.p1 TRINITY_DN5977_c0_g1~~TRINITY_DN5977_c0_g1_i3.p1  ORF type:complete len:2290 (+),score=357.80 TRINITY_DN5977_c0_g1_i3:108-6977(+)